MMTLKILLFLISISLIKSCALDISFNQNDRKFDRKIFIQSKEYKDYFESQNFVYQQIIIELEIEETGQKIVANNSGEALAIKKYLKRKYNYTAVELDPPKLTKENPIS